MPDLTRDKTRELRELGIRPYNKIIHDQDREWLQENFSKGATKFPVNVSALVRNILWQTWARIQDDEREQFNELIRTFWYTHVKPTLQRANALSEESDQAGEITEALVRLAVDEDLMDYADIGFRDENKANRSVRTNANIILFAEKIGHAAFLEEMGEKFQMATIALGGQPSAMTVEYFVDNIRKTGIDIRRSFFLFSIVDYDTSGWIIKDAFVDNLKKQGIKNIEVHDLVNPDRLSPEELSFSTFRIPEHRNIAEKNTEWLREINEANFDNQPLMGNDRSEDPRQIFGLEAEAVSTDRMEDKLDELVPPLLGADERTLKINALEDFTESLNDLIVQKATQ